MSLPAEVGAFSCTIPSMSNADWRTLARRSFFSKVGFGLIGGAAVGAAPAQAQSPGRFDPVRHPQDDWLDQIPGGHRYILDAPNPDGFSSAIQFTTTYFNINVNDYGLKDSDLAVVLVARHASTLFAYSDAIWAKYGKPISERNRVLDPKTNQPPTVNLQRERLEPLIKRGLRLAVCNQSSRGYAAAIAMAMGLKQDEVFEEMKANLLPNARLVPAGIVAINRAQERGFSLASVEHT
jgi:intracellular sulfur oxidation DsrE/DsrF family protein